MIVSSLSPSYRSHPVKTNPSATSFHSVFSQTVAESETARTNSKTASAKKTDGFMPLNPIPVLRNPGSYQPPQVVGSLTTDEKLLLQSKYDFATMEYDSGEYHSLMRDLYALGVISNTPYAFPMNIVDYTTDAEGNITSMLTKTGEEDTVPKVEEWFFNVMENYGEHYQNAMERLNRSKADDLFMKRFESDLSLKSIFEDLLTNG